MKCVILELIPTSSNPNYGDIIQLSALKINNLKLIDRFDYRLSDSKVPMDSMLELISYDKELFVYVDSTEKIINQFKEWIKDYKLLIIDNAYTLNYLKGIKNEKESVLNYLNMKYHDNIINEIINKYHLKPSNYIVDLLYEALIYESNNN